AWIEIQLAHVDKNTIRGTYNHAIYLKNRRIMLQWYSDKLMN
ncbi:integrase, partial [Escherichia coli]